jgi:hypothetical protein
MNEQIARGLVDFHGRVMKRYGNSRRHATTVVESTLKNGVDRQSLPVTSSGEGAAAARPRECPRPDHYH